MSPKKEPVLAIVAKDDRTEFSVSLPILANPAEHSAKRFQERPPKQDADVLDAIRLIPVDPGATATGKSGVRAATEYFGGNHRYAFTEFIAPERDPRRDVHPVATWPDDAQLDLRPADHLARPAAFAEWLELFVYPALNGDRE